MKRLFNLVAIWILLSGLSYLFGVAWVEYPRAFDVILFAIGLFAIVSVIYEMVQERKEKRKRRL